MAVELIEGTYYFGGSGNDTLSVGGMEVVIGLGGDDTLESIGVGASLSGTVGDDRYLANGYVTQIMDTSGNDTVVLPSALDAYQGGLIDDQHLILYDQWTGNTILVLDFVGSGRIEQFETVYGDTLSADQVESRIKSEGYSFSWADIAPSMGLSADEAEAIFEIDKVIGKLDWLQLFQDLASAGNTEPATVANFIDAQAKNGLLSDRAKVVWNEADVKSSLSNSQFIGIEDNVSFEDTQVTQDEAENIALLYEAALDRSPDVSGLNYWIDEFENGMSIEDIADRFIDSNEFKSSFDVNNDAEFVDQLYQNVLDRTPDPEGRNWWLNEITSGARDQSDVLVGFSLSPENEANATWLAGLQETSEGNWAVMG